MQETSAPQECSVSEPCANDDVVAGDDESRWLSEEEQRAWREFSFMVLRLDSELSAAMGAGCELRYHDYLVLVVLTDQDDGRVRPIRLRELLGWEKSTLTRQIDRMERRGLVIRERCESDRRGSVVAVTEAGREAIAREAPRHVRAVREYFVDRLTSSQLESLYEIARAVSGDDNAWSQADNGECSQT